MKAAMPAISHAFLPAHDAEATNQPVQEKASSARRPAVINRNAGPEMQAIGIDHADGTALTQALARTRAGMRSVPSAMAPDRESSPTGDTPACTQPASASLKAERIPLFQFMGDQLDHDRFGDDVDAANRTEVQSIGVARNNCWMRAFWLAAINDCDSPDNLKQRLCNRLADRKDGCIAPHTEPQKWVGMCIEPVGRVTALEYAEAADAEGAPTLAQQIEVIYQAACDWKNHRLERNDSPCGPFQKTVDQAIIAVSRALLEKDLEDRQLPPTEHEAAAIDIVNATTGEGMGDDEQIAILARALGIDMVICVEAGAVSIAPFPGSALDAVANPPPTEAAAERQIPNANHLLAAALELGLSMLLYEDRHHYELNLKSTGWATDDMRGTVPATPPLT